MSESVLSTTARESTIEMAGVRNMTAGQILATLGLGSIAAGALVYGLSGSALAPLAHPTTAGQILISATGPNAPAWSGTSLTYASGVLTIAGSAPLSLTSTSSLVSRMETSSASGVSVAHEFRSNGSLFWQFGLAGGTVGNKSFFIYNHVTGANALTIASATSAATFAAGITCTTVTASGDISTSASNFISSNAGGMNIINNNSGPVNIWSGGSVRVTVNTSGALLIGTDPGGSELLRVGGSGRFSGLLTCAGGVNLNGDNLSKNAFYGRYSAGDPTFYVSNGAGVACAIALQTYDGTTTRDALRLTAGGGAIFANSITHGSATLLTTSVSLTNGAAAAAGTLTNAPAAGNPTKWIPINDNGTTRYIPAW